MRCFLAIRSTVVSIPYWVRVRRTRFFSSAQLCTLHTEWLVDGVASRSRPTPSHDAELRRASHLSSVYLNNSVDKSMAMRLFAD